MNARRGLYDDPRHNERAYPYMVDIAVPEGGLGKRLDGMHDWHRARFLESRSGRGGCRDGTWFVRWCFKDQRDAEDFMAAFGGTLESKCP